MAAPTKATRLRVLSCPNCGGSVTLRAGGLSISAICASCGSTIDVLDPDLKVIAEAQKRTREPPIAIGTRATLVGSLWEVIGYQVKRDPGEGWTWDEYLLFSPYEGFRFLVRDDEDFVLYAMLPQDVEDPGKGVGDGRNYKPLSTGTAVTDYVLGEFYWRARVGDQVSVSEYAAPPYLLSCEQNGEEIIWSRGVQLTGATVETAFKLKTAPTLLDRATTRRDGTTGAIRFALLATLLLVIADIVPFGSFRNQLVWQQSFTAAASDQGRPLSGPSFSIPGHGGNLRIDLHAPVRNGWAQFGLSLVPEGGGKAFDAISTIEYYSGTDSDGFWSEGSRDSDVSFASIPGGSYRLLVDVNASTFTPLPGKPVGFTVKLTRHAPDAWFFVLALLALWIYPIWRKLRDRFSPPLPGRGS